MSKLSTNAYNFGTPRRTQFQLWRVRFHLRIYGNFRFLLLEFFEHVPELKLFSLKQGRV